MEHYIFQNNAVNIYENYFDDLEEAAVLHETCSSRTVNVYRDPLGSAPVNSIIILSSERVLLSFIFTNNKYLPPSSDL